MNEERQNNRARTYGAIGLLVAAAVGGYLLLHNPLRYEAGPRPAAADFEEFYQARLAESRQQNVRPGNEERLLRVAPGRTAEAILYIHGFGASRGEGEEVVDQLAAMRQANTYYMRLPGHGAGMEEHARPKWTEYLDAVEQAFAMMPQLGEKTILVGSSTGALLAMHLAAQHPDQVHALVIASPLIEYRNPAGAILGLPGGIHLIHALYGEVRDAGWKDDPEKRRVDGYEEHWTVRQRYTSAVELDRLRRFIAVPETYKRIVAPTLMLYYYENEEKQDEAVSVQAMLDAFAQLGQFKAPSPLNRAVAIPDGNHILFSKYVRVDKAPILTELRAFFEALDASSTVAPAR